VMKAKSNSQRRPRQALGEIILCEPASLDGSPIWRFFCEYCTRWHSHAAGAGLRIAHCTNRNSPYTRGGYELRLDPRFARGGR